MLLSYEASSLYALAFCARTLLRRFHAFDFQNLNFLGEVVASFLSDGSNLSAVRTGRGIVKSSGSAISAKRILAARLTDLCDLCLSNPDGLFFEATPGLRLLFILVRVDNLALPPRNLCDCCTDYLQVNDVSIVLLLFWAFVYPYLPPGRPFDYLSGFLRCLSTCF